MVDQSLNDWIIWNGGECPVPNGTLIDWKDRSGHVTHGYKVEPKAPPLCLNWEHRGMDSDVMAYRVISCQDDADKIYNEASEVAYQTVVTLAKEWQRRALKAETALQCAGNFIAALGDASTRKDEVGTSPVSPSPASDTLIEKLQKRKASYPYPRHLKNELCKGWYGYGIEDAIAIIRLHEAEQTPVAVNENAARDAFFEWREELRESNEDMASIYDTWELQCFKAGYRMANTAMGERNTEPKGGEAERNECDCLRRPDSEGMPAGSQPASPATDTLIGCRGEFEEFHRKKFPFCGLQYSPKHNSYASKTVSDRWQGWQDAIESRCEIRLINETALKAAIDFNDSIEHFGDVNAQIRDTIEAYLAALPKRE